MIHFIIWLLIIILYFPVFWRLYNERWESVDYTHAYFILPISIWLTWRNRLKIKEALTTQNTKKEKIFGFIMLVSGILMFIFASYEEYLSIMTLSLIPLLIGMITYLYGSKIIKILYFPIFYLLLLVPPPAGVLDSLTFPMRYGVSFMAEKILSLLGYPITREGLLLTIGYSDIFMGPPCSGFRSLITMFSLILVYVYITKGNMVKKITLTFFIVPFALLGNLIRVIILSLITFYFGEEIGQGFFHYFSGVVIFIFTLLGIIGVELIINKLQDKREARSILSS